jgi:hypothetical protein
LEAVPVSVITPFVLSSDKMISFAFQQQPVVINNDKPYRPFSLDRSV